MECRAAASDGAATSCTKHARDVAFRHYTGDATDPDNNSVSIRPPDTDTTADRTAGISGALPAQSPGSLPRVDNSPRFRAPVIDMAERKNFVEWVRLGCACCAERGSSRAMRHTVLLVPQRARNASDSVTASSGPFRHAEIHRNDFFLP
jgi:hypothetical protein